MARVRTSVAAKDYPAYGIKKGDTYWHWTPYRQKRRMSATPPRPSQTETNETKADLYGIQEEMSDSLAAALKLETFEDRLEAVKAAVEAAHEDSEGVYEAFNEKADNIEDGFGHETTQSEELREWADEVESWRDELDDYKEPESDDPDFDLENFVASIPDGPQF